MTKQILHMKPQTHKQSRTATEIPPWSVNSKTTGKGLSEIETPMFILLWIL